MLARKAAIVLSGLWFGFRWKSNYTALLIRMNPHERVSLKLDSA
jgi:hypothetical protein